MRQIVDRATFDQITATCMRTYLAVQSSNFLAEEAGRLQALADRLLHAAGIAYLNESLPGLPSQPADNPAASEYSEAFMEVQRLSAELQGELRRVGERRIASGDPQSAAALLQALGETPPDLQPLDALACEAKNHFAKGEWLRGRALLRGFLAVESIRILYGRSYVDETFSNIYRQCVEAYQALLYEFPDFVAFCDRKYGNGSAGAQTSADTLWYKFMEWVNAARKEAK